MRGYCYECGEKLPPGHSSGLCEDCVPAPWTDAPPFWTPRTVTVAIALSAAVLALFLLLTR